MQQTFKIQIKGRVQGVGFRPFIYNLANSHNLNGTVSNNGNGVIIFCNSTETGVTKFVDNILANKPQIAWVKSHLITKVSFQEFYKFKIITSDPNVEIDLPLTPDFATCDCCKLEISDTINRRFNYAFTTCVNCGPRYAITKKFPFERQHTSLDDFGMCKACGQEYKNPEDRRFHSQTNSCPDCGIKLKLEAKDKRVLTINQTECIDRAANFLISGHIIAVKNTNGYLLCCDASNPKSIGNLRRRKKRSTKPFAVLYPSIESVEEDFDTSLYQRNALCGAAAPIVILQNKQHINLALEAIAPNINQTGVMLPSSGLLQLLMLKIGRPIVATSGNIHGSPIISNEDDANKNLSDVADYFLHHDMEVQFPQDDSVIKFSDDLQIILRRSRGFAPNYLETDIKSKKPILAMGAHLKSTISYLPKNQIYVSQYIGNLDNYKVLKRYQSILNKYFKIFGVNPKCILVDKHPNYQSSILGAEIASELDCQIQKIQHHKAHFTSVLGEHNLFKHEEKVLGVIWDGTGYGDDMHIWGGEFFIYDRFEISRLTHFEYFSWIANDKMANEPRLALFSLLNHENRDYLRHKFSKMEWDLYSKILKNNKLKTSSVGRLFDAVASALDLTDSNTFEAEAAMRLEDCANLYSGNNPIDFLENKIIETIPSRLIVNEILKLYKNGAFKERLAYSFIYTLAKSITDVARKHGIKTVACSGGVFQNSLLLSILVKQTEKININLKLNRKLSSNDENLSFGQLMYSQFIKN